MAHSAVSISRVDSAAREHDLPGAGCQSRRELPTTGSAHTTQIPETMVSAATPNGNIVVIGYGTIGQCVLPLLLERLDLPASRFVVVDRIAPPDLLAPFRAAGLHFQRRTITRDNLAEVLAEVAGPGDVLINLSVGIDSIETADWCHRNGVRYVDTAIEPWQGYVEDLAIPASERTEYALHQKARRQAANTWRGNGPTAVLTHGANPGLVSSFAKAAVLDVARSSGLEVDDPATSKDWAQLSRRAGIKIIHISERDTQVTDRPRAPGEFVNTWSVAGFVEEAMMPVELGWGTHERTFPDEAADHPGGPRNAIYLDQPAARFFLYSWVPSNGQILGMALPHSETVTLSEYLTETSEGRVVYRPTVAFVYLPCESAFSSLHETMMGGWREPDAERVIRTDVTDGQDELGVLLLGHKLNGWWFGSQLDIHEARRIVPHSNPTALQVSAGVVAATMWALVNPAEGYCEPEDLPHDFVLDVARPYLGRMPGVQTDWTPLAGDRFLDDPAEPRDPWQFANFRLGR
jgi:homospermidine synthase